MTSATLIQRNHDAPVGFAHLTLRRAATVDEVMALALDHFANPLVKNPTWTHLQVDLGGARRLAPKRDGG